MQHGLWETGDKVWGMWGLPLLCHKFFLWNTADGHLSPTDWVTPVRQPWDTPQEERRKVCISGFVQRRETGRILRPRNTTCVFCECYGGHLHLMLLLNLGVPPILSAIPPFQPFCFPLLITHTCMFTQSLGCLFLMRLCQLNKQQVLRSPFSHGATVFSE